VHVGKLGQITNFTIVGGTAKHYMVLFRYCLLGGDTAILGGLHTRLCHRFLFSVTMSANAASQKLLRAVLLAYYYVNT